MWFRKTKFVLTVGVWLVFASGAGCDDFATPAELDRPQILGIAADPPAVALGETTALSIYVAGPDGEVVDPEVVWEVVSVGPGLPQLGRIDPASPTPTFVAPDDVPEEPTLAMVQATVSVGEQPLLGQKAIVVGRVVLSNPMLTRFAAGGTDLLTDELRMFAGDVVSLSVDIAPEQDKDTTYSWYSTVGTIAAYRSAPTDLEAPEEPASGWLFVVVRDGRGGIVWRKARVVVE